MHDCQPGAKWFIEQCLRCLAGRREPLSYKEFILQLPDEITPEDAQRDFQAYLADYWGSQIRAEFESKRNEDWYGPAAMSLSVQCL